MTLERTEDSDVARIYDLWREYGAAATAGDLHRWIDLWIEDGIQMAPDAPARVGKEVIRAQMQPLFELFDTRMAVYPDEVQVLGEQAYTHGSYEFVMAPMEGGDSTQVKGKFLTILRRQADGSWKIAVDCFNHDAPLAARISSG